jgi:hypothetical protein
MGGTRPDDSLVDDNASETKKKKAIYPPDADDPLDGRSSPAQGKGSSSAPIYLEFRELLRHLSAVYARSSSRLIRTGIMISYTTAFKGLGAQFVHINYSVILDHILKDVGTHPLIKDDRYRALETRRHIKLLLCDVLRRQLLNEPAKIMALRTIINFLQNETKENDSEGGYFVERTVCALSELAGLLQDLGSAIYLEQVGCPPLQQLTQQESLQRIFRCLIKHSHPAVQAAASWGLRSFVLAAPAQMEPMLQECRSDLDFHLEKLQDTNIPHGRIALGIAQGVAVVVQAYPFRPSYFSTSVVTEIWTFAGSLLQMSGKSDLRSSQHQIQAAWTLIGALMSVGAQFVKSHLNQLLLLWKNALPRPFSKDMMASRNIAELQYLLHVKERALAALSLFLQYNDKMLTLDTSRRIVTMLSDTSVFVARLPVSPITEDVRVQSSYSQLAEGGIKVTMRVMRCYCHLIHQDSRNLASPELLMSAISVFGDPDRQVPTSSNVKPTVVGSMDILTSTSDNFAWGASSGVRFLSIPGNSGQGDGIRDRHWSVWGSDVDLLEQMVCVPMIFNS